MGMFQPRLVLRMVLGAIAAGGLVSAVPATAGEAAKTIDEFLAGKGRVPEAAGTADPAGAAVAEPPAATPNAAAPQSDQPLPAPAITPPEIQWRLENAFRFFTDPADTEVHRATYAALTPEERATPILSAERALSRRHDEGWAATMYRKTCWSTDANRHVCGGKTNYLEPATHAVIVELKGVEERDVECTWLTAPMGGRNIRGTAKKQPCGEPARFDVPYPDGMGLTVEIGGREVAASEIKVRDILVAGVGDSFGSGEGNPDIPVRFSRERAADYGGADTTYNLLGYPARVGSWERIGDPSFIEGGARWMDTACHRSLYSHQIRAALQLAVEDPHRAVTLVDVACSGAEVTFGLFLRYKGNEWVPTPPELSQISAIAEAQCGDKDAPMQDLPEAYHMQGTIPELQGGLVLKKCARDAARRIDLLLVSIGGNDIGFARLVANAVLADQSLVKRLGGWFGQIHGNAESKALLDRLDLRYKSLNRALHGILHVPWEQGDRVILAAYPPLAVLGDGNSVCPDGNAGMEVYQDFSLTEKRARESSRLADQLQNVMAKSAKTYGWSFAELHRKAFLGRGLCAGYTDNAFSIADDLRLPRKVAGVWQPFNPADFKAYDTRERWVRTPNDAFMVGNFHVSGSVIQKALKLQSLSWFQVLLASTYGGAFHPTAEGQASIGDAVADKARAVLAKYGQGEKIVASGPK